jgi:hypothetical protein
MANIVNNENYPIESSPLITLRGKVLNGDVKESPRTPKSNEKRYNNFRNSPRRSTPNSPKISRLPIRSGANTRFSIKELRLPPDESVTNCEGVGSGVRVTPEKLMEELRDEVKKQKRKMDGPPRIVDEEISLSVSNCILEEMTSETDNLSLRPRMSMRNRPVTVDAPDLVYEDPLKVARQTLANTRANSGYKQCKLIYTTEKRRTVRSSSPEPAFSKKTGITRHFLNVTVEEEEDMMIEDSYSSFLINPLNSYASVGFRKSLKFDRVLKLFDSSTEAELEVVDISEIDLEMKPKKPCLKPLPSPSPSTKSQQLPVPVTTQIVQIKRICYEDDEIGAEEGGSPTKKRRIGNGAKRQKKND